MKWLDRDLITGPYLFLATNEEQFRQALSHCEVPPHKQPAEWLKPGKDGLATYLDNPKGELVCIISIATRPDIDGVQIAGLLVHEAVHVWQEFRERMGDTAPSREFEAYSIQAIAQRLMEAYADQLAPPAAALKRKAPGFRRGPR